MLFLDVQCESVTYRSDKKKKIKEKTLPTLYLPNSVASWKLKSKTFFVFHFRYSLARGHARLNLNTEVRETDALMAVKLYEETITARFGMFICRLF